MNDKTRNDVIPGVGCDVTNCSASKISVQNEKANTKGETYCSTFCPRGCC